MLVPIISLPHIGVLLQGRAALSMACTEVLLTCIGENLLKMSHEFLCKLSLGSEEETGESRWTVFLPSRVEVLS